MEFLLTDRELLNMERRDAFYIRDDSGNEMKVLRHTYTEGFHQPDVTYDINNEEDLIKKGVDIKKLKEFLATLE